MATKGFNSTQIKQLSGMFEHVVDTLGETILQSENRTKKELRTEISDFRSELKTDVTQVREDLRNYVTTTATKYQVKRLEKAIFPNL